MSDEILNILSQSNDDLDNQKMIDYLNGKLSDEEKHEVEKNMVDSAFINDAVEGLENLKNKKNIKTLVEQLNAGLQTQIDKKKARKNKRKLKDQPWLYLTIIIILILIIISFSVIKKHLESEKDFQNKLQKTEKTIHTNGT